MLTFKKPLNRISNQKRSMSKYCFRFVIYLFFNSFYLYSYLINGLLSLFHSFGENQYNAMQKREFTVLPPVLCVSLSRFRYDVKSQQINKNNKLFKFDAELDLSKYMPDSSYTLHSVLGN